MRKMMIDAIEDNDSESADVFARNVAEVYRYDRLRLLEKWLEEADEMIRTVQYLDKAMVAEYQSMLEEAEFKLRDREANMEILLENSRNAALEDAARVCDECGNYYASNAIRKMKEE